MSYDLGAAYRAARERITTLVGSADAGVHDATRVPATPAWTVHDVLAHVSGVAADAATGNMAGAPGDEWTAAQVQRGRALPMATLLAQWAEHAPVLEGLLSSPNGGAASAAVIDIHSHEADLRHALGLAAQLPHEFLAWVGPAMRSRFAGQVAEAGLPAVEVAADDFEWFRASLGRRTVDEVCAYGWSSDGAPVDPAPYLDCFFIFGRAQAPLGECRQ